MAEIKISGLRNQSKIIDLTGQRFGYLVVLSRAPYRKGEKLAWLCQCDCGNIKPVSRSDLRRGGTRSCGCQSGAMRWSKRPRPSTSKTPTYNSWKSMINRCTNKNAPDYHRYGGRGITFCPEWRSFQAFLFDMGERPKDKTLDRIDNSKSYSKTNCQWSTSKKQSRNTCRTTWLEFNGKIQSLRDWCDQLGLTRYKVNYRLKHGWPIEKVLSQETFRSP